jgi:hypothetical protein
MPVWRVFETRVEGHFTDLDIPEARRWNNVWHVGLVQEDDPGTPSDADLYDETVAIATYINGLYSSLAAYYSNNVLLDFVRAQRIDGALGPFALSSVPWTGAIAISDPVEPDNALVLTKRTLRGGRRFLGRCYLPPLPTNVMGAGSWNEFGEAFIEIFLLFTEPYTWEGKTYQIGVWSATAYEESPTIEGAFAVLHRLEFDRVVRRMTTRDSRVRLPQAVVEPPA